VDGDLQADVASELLDEFGDVPLLQLGCPAADLDYRMRAIRRAGTEDLIISDRNLTRDALTSTYF